MAKKQFAVDKLLIPNREHATFRAVGAFNQACDSSHNFLTAFDAAVAERGRGATSDRDQDLLRAMLVFASAGLDASVTHLGRDCAHGIYEKSSNLQEAVEKFAQKELAMDTKPTKFLLDLIKGSQKMLYNNLAKEYLTRETASSLQSPNELKRICSLFGIMKDLTMNIDSLRDAFRVRNLIIHEMDVNFEAQNRSRTSRTRDEMSQYTEDILGIARKIIQSTQQKLNERELL